MGDTWKWPATRIAAAVARGEITARAAAEDALARLAAVNPRINAVVQELPDEAIAAGGASLRDYRRADGELGYFQLNFLVYGREGEPCRRDGCRGGIVRIVQSGRSTFHCSKCQR